MGCASAKNCVPEDHGGFLKYPSERHGASPRKFRKRRLSSTSTTGSSQLFSVHRQNDLNGSSIPGHIQITTDHLILFEGYSSSTSWELETLSEYGKGSDIFQFKTGGKSATGRKLFRFHSRSADVILKELEQALQRKQDEIRIRRLQMAPQSMSRAHQSSTSIDSINNKPFRYHNDRQCYTASELIEPTRTQPRPPTGTQTAPQTGNKLVKPSNLPVRTRRKEDRRMYPRNRSSSMHNIGGHHYENVNDLHDSTRSGCSENLNYVQLEMGYASEDNLFSQPPSCRHRRLHSGCGHGSVSSSPTRTTNSGPSTPDFSDTDSKTTSSSAGQKMLKGYDYAKIDITKTQALARFRQNSIDNTDDGWRMTRHSSGNLF